MFAALLGLVLTSRLSANEMTHWGWRIPLFAGCMIIPVLFILRRSLAETPVFAARKHHPMPREILGILAAHWKLVLLGIMLTTMTTVSYYMITAYTPTFGSSVLHLTAKQQHDRDVVRRSVEFFLDSGDGSMVRQDREASAADRHYSAGAVHRVSGSILAGGRAVFFAAA